jgi:DNA mismatch endonuclease (patch repair protein)
VLGVRNWRRHIAITFSSTGDQVRPDFVFRDNRLAVFVDGCLWHRCRLHARIPSTNRAYWSAKLRRNVRRDRIADQLLKRAGWRVIRIWEHSIKRDPLRCGKRVLRRLAMGPKSSRVKPD